MVWLPLQEWDAFTATADAQLPTAYKLSPVKMAH